MRRCVRSGCTNPVGTLGGPICGACLAADAAATEKEEAELLAYVACGLIALNEFMRLHAAFDDWLAAHKGSG